MSFDRLKWLKDTLREAEQEPERTAADKGRLTLLALLADEDGIVQTEDFERALNLAPQDLQARWGPAIRLKDPADY